MEDKRRVFIPEKYLAPSERKGVLELPNLGIGKIIPYKVFNGMLGAGVISKRIVPDLAFRILED